MSKEGQTLLDSGDLICFSVGNLDGKLLVSYKPVNRRASSAGPRRITHLFDSHHDFHGV